MAIKHLPNSTVGSTGNETVAAKPKRRWRQYSLRAMLLLVTAVCILLALWIAPLWREGQVISQIRALGGQVETVPIRPEWLAKLLSENLSQHARTVILVGDNFDDALFHRLHDLPQLELVTLTNTNVTLRAVEQFVDRKPDVHVNLAFAEHLYQEAKSIYKLGLTFDSMLPQFNWAADWKVACARFKASPHEAQIKARQQLVHWLDREVEHARIIVANGAKRPSQADLDLAICALAIAEVQLAQATGDRPEEAAACRRGQQAAASMCDAAWARYSMQKSALQPLIHALRLKDELQRAQYNLDHDDEAQLAALTALSDAYGRLRNSIGGLREVGLRGGEEHKYALVSTVHSALLARLAKLKGNAGAEKESLVESARFSKELREANLEAYQIGVLTQDELLSGEQLGLECELALARASDDSTAAQRAISEYRASLVRHWKRTHALWAAGVRGGEDHKLASIACRLATAEIDASGEDFFHKAQANIEADWEQAVGSSAD